jgi:hypothetical protein
MHAGEVHLERPLREVQWPGGWLRIKSDGGWPACAGVKVGLHIGALKGGRGGRQEGCEALVCQVAPIQPIGAHQDGGEVDPIKPSGCPGPEAGCCVVECRPLACEGSAEGARWAERPEGGGHGPQGDLSGTNGGQKGGISLQVGGDAKIELSRAHGEGELGHDGLRGEVLWGRVVHQEKGGKEHLPPSSGDVRGEPLPRRGVGEASQAGLDGGARGTSPVQGQEGM